MFTQTSLFREQAFRELDACSILKTVADHDTETATAVLKKLGGIQKVAQASDVFVKRKSQQMAIEKVSTRVCSKNNDN